MDTPLRPDLARILPQPVVRARAAQGRFSGAVETAAAAQAPDWVLDVHRPPEHDATAPGFGLQQAIAVAKRVAGWLGSNAPADVHRIAAPRAQQVLDVDAGRENGRENVWSPRDRS